MGDTIFPLSLRLSGIEFSLVSDSAKLDSASYQTKLNSVPLSLRLRGIHLIKWSEFQLSLRLSGIEFSLV